MKIRIGTRKSQLAIKQTEMVAEKLKREFPEDEFEIVGISTKGDKILDKSLQSFGGKGVFIKELETALINGEIDMAVHSAKDMPTELPDGLRIGAVMQRGAHEDVMISFSDKMPHIIGTGSVRREVQIKDIYHGSEIKPIRGNINTRIEKLKNGEYDAIIIAKAALERLGIDDLHITPLDFVCAAGQGIIAVETREGDLEKYMTAINHADTALALCAERAFLSATGGGCHSPSGAYAVISNGIITMETMLVRDGKIIRKTLTGTDPIEIAERAVK
ncbi:MAG: hydroxymethylbilane synthase [Oscillospiraceae bacterium]|nr:hydroxymethylbilane synthase [Oscillospiraceae bacterium]